MADETKKTALTEEQAEQVSGGKNPFVEEGADAEVLAHCRFCNAPHMLVRQTPRAYPQKIGKWGKDTVYFYICNIKGDYYYEKVLPDGRCCYYYKNGEPLT